MPRFRWRASLDSTRRSLADWQTTARSRGKYLYPSSSRTYISSGLERTCLTRFSLLKRMLVSSDKKKLLAKNVSARPAKQGQQTRPDKQIQRPGKANHV